MRDDTTVPRQHTDGGSAQAGAEAWDAFYAGAGDGAAVWSGQPNGSLVAEAADLEPGTALDVGCGEGADAIWLAHRGWEVTALDPSAVALERATAAAARAAVTVAWIHGGLIEMAAELATFDLVSVQYGVLPVDVEATAIGLLCRAVAPGGRLLVVHHEFDGAHGGHDPLDHADLVLPDDVAAHLGDEWRIETHERRQRAGALPAEARHIRDVVLRARRLGGRRPPDLGTTSRSSASRS